MPLKLKADADISQADLIRHYNKMVDDFDALHSDFERLQTLANMRLDHVNILQDQLGITRRLSLTINALLIVLLIVQGVVLS